MSRVIARGKKKPALSTRFADPKKEKGEKGSGRGTYARAAVVSITQAGPRRGGERSKVSHPGP